jgi:hypothetical protein
MNNSVGAYKALAQVISIGEPLPPLVLALVKSPLIISVAFPFVKEKPYMGKFGNALADDGV